MSKNKPISAANQPRSLRKDAIFLWFSVLFVLLIVPINSYVSQYYSHLIPFLIKYIVPGIISFLLMLVVIPLTIIIARKCNAVVQPEYPKQLLKAIPLLGGMAIFVVMMTVQFFYWPPPKEVMSIYLGAMIILILGTIDDIRPISSITRLAGQLLASGIIMSSGMLVSFFPDTFLGNHYFCYCYVGLDFGNY